MVAHELADDDPLRIGDALIVARLGEGGMGIVYLGRLPTGDAVAVKVVKGEFAADADYRRRFAREVAALRDLGGTHTAAVVDADINGDPPWLIMEYVQGPTLAERIGRNGPMTESEARQLASGLAECIAVIHAAGVVHRDLKPSNVVLSPDGPKLVDFGVAFGADGDADVGLRVGSLSWMAPEQIDGRTQGWQCDIHAFGLLLYYAACGRPAYGYGDPEAIAWRIGNSRPMLVDLPEELLDLAPVVAAALAKDPCDRPPAVVFLRGHSGERTVDCRRAGREGDAAPAAPGVAVASPAAPGAGGSASGQVAPAGPTAPVASRRPWWRSVILGAVTVWLVGWTIGGWPLVPWSHADVPPASGCAPAQTPVNLAAGTVAAASGSGPAKNVWYGNFPGPLGEFRIPVETIACELGPGVRVVCPDYTLPDGAAVTCRAQDAKGGSRPVEVQRTAATYSWTLAG